jgi:hypothetical protein
VGAPWLIVGRPGPSQPAIVFLAEAYHSWQLSLVAGSLAATRVVIAACCASTACRWWLPAVPLQLAWTAVLFMAPAACSSRLLRLGYAQQCEGLGWCLRLECRWCGLELCRPAGQLVWSICMAGAASACRCCVSLTVPCNLLPGGMQHMQEGAPALM